MALVPVTTSFTPLDEQVHPGYTPVFQQNGAQNKLVFGRHLQTVTDRLHIRPELT
jgi:hypothetical protein